MCARNWMETTGKRGRDDALGKTDVGQGREKEQVCPEGNTVMFVKPNSHPNGDAIQSF